MAHPFVGDVGDLMDNINIVIHLRLESEQYRRFYNHDRSVVLKKEADQALKELEYTMFDLLDQAKESGIQSEVATHHS